MSDQENKQLETAVYCTVDDFFVGAKKTNLAIEVKTEMEKEEQDSLVDRDLLRRQEDWGKIANQVVGAEND